MTTFRITDLEFNFQYSYENRARIRRIWHLIANSPYISANAKIRISSCGTVICLEKGTNRLIAANSCKERFCPPCNSRKSAKDHRKILSSLSKLHSSYSFLYCTLTVSNISDNNLPLHIERLLKAFTKFVKYKDINRIIKGYIRKLEITHNKASTTYHPHLHVIFAVNKSYNTDTIRRLSIKQWFDFWERACSDLPVSREHFDIEFVGNEMLVLDKIASYLAKDLKSSTSTDNDNIYTYGQKVFDTFCVALSGRKLIVKSGVFRNKPTFSRLTIRLKKKSQSLKNTTVYYYKNDKFVGSK